MDSLHHFSVLLKIRVQLSINFNYFVFLLIKKKFYFIMYKIKMAINYIKTYF